MAKVFCTPNFEHPKLVGKNTNEYTIVPWFFGRIGGISFLEKKGIKNIIVFHNAKKDITYFEYGNLLDKKQKDYYWRQFGNKPTQFY